MWFRESSKEKISMLSMLGVVMLWGVAWPAGRILSLEVPAFTAAFLRFSLVFPLLFLFSFLLHVNIKLPKRTLLVIMVLGFIQVTLYNFLFLTGVKYTSASDAVLIISVNPVLTAIISAIRYKDEHLTWNRVFGLILSLIGVALIAYQSPNTHVENRLLGDLIIFGAALAWAVYTTFSRPVYETVHPLAFNAWSSFFGWVFLGILSFNQQPWNTTLSPPALLSLLYLAVIAAALANTIFSSSVKYIGPSRTAVFVNLVPVFGVFSSFIILQENISIIYLLSFLIIAMGIYLVQKEQLKQARKTTEASKTRNIQINDH